MKRCVSCSTEKKYSDFHKDGAKSDGYHTQCKTCRRNYYDRNREERLNYNKNWNSQNKDKIANFNKVRLLSLEGRARQLWLAARLRARKKNAEFDLSLARINVALILGKCERTGIEFDLTPQEDYRINPFSPSIDKIDPFKNYTNDNIRVVCSAYNIAKNQLSEQEFLELCKKVVEFNQ